MATAAVARPAQPLRRTRDAPRPAIGKRNVNMDGGSTQPTKKRKLDEPYVRTSDYILQKHAGKPPSMIIHLHPTHFKFEGQDGSFAYDSEMKCVLEHIQAHTVPHQMMSELLELNVRFYDGCLIMEVHNHRSNKGKDTGRHDSTAVGNKEKFSMHRHTAYITPSPYEPYPENAARGDETPVKVETSNRDMPAPEKPKEKDGPSIFTSVLHPTELSKYHEMLILSETPVDQMRSRKRGNDSSTPSGTQPTTPQLPVPPTPGGSRGQLSQSQKMCLEEGDIYTFQGDMLLATEPPLYLEPADNPREAQKILDLLEHPLHQEQPPSPKTRKRTTAEVAADDAQQQETERRMLIMDERIKPSGTGAATNENQGAAASLTFSRFKTIDLVRQKLEEAERVRKEEEVRAAAEKKQAEEQAVMQQRANAAQQRREMGMMAQHQPNQQQQQQQQQQMLLMRQRQEQQLRAQAVAQAQQQAIMGTQHHAHPQQNGMMSHPQQNNQQSNQGQLAQGSPVVRQQTPMIHSSPMLQQGGFPMARTSSQGAGSPPRPTSAAMQPHPMARQISQQQQGSRHVTPHIQQGTPNMAQAMPNRQMTQTPRMPPGSPANNMHQGTPSAGPMALPTAQMGGSNGFTQQQVQMAMLQQQRTMAAQQQSAEMQAGSSVNNMTPEQIQAMANNQQRQNAQNAMRQQSMLQAQAQAQNNPQMAMQMKQRQQQILMRQQQMQQARDAHMQGSPAPGQAGSPGQMPQQTPQMQHAHPQQFPGQQGNMPDLSHMSVPQQQQVAAAIRAKHLAEARQNHQQANPQAQANQMQHQQAMVTYLKPFISKYQGLHNIPAEEINAFPPQVKTYIAQYLQSQRNQAMQKQMQQQQMQQQQQRSQQGGSGNMEQVPAQQPNPQYMQQLRANQAMLAQHQQRQNGGMHGMTGLSFDLNGGGGQQNFGGNQQNNGADLGPQFAAMRRSRLMNEVL